MPVHQASARVSHAPSDTDRRRSDLLAAPVIKRVRMDFQKFRNDALKQQLTVRIACMVSIEAFDSKCGAAAGPKASCDSAEF